MKCILLGQIKSTNVDDLFNMFYGLQKKQTTIESSNRIIEKAYETDGTTLNSTMTTTFSTIPNSTNRRITSVLQLKDKSYTKIVDIIKADGVTTINESYTEVV